MSVKNTAIIITDPYNDFLHPKGKLNGMVAESLTEKNVLVHLKELLMPRVPTTSPSTTACTSSSKLAF
jgi:hypothetical protein